MNRRDLLKRHVGTTIAVAVALPFVPDADGHITDDANELDMRAWWRENFTIQNVEYAKNSFGANLIRVRVSQNGRPDRVMYAVVVVSDEAAFDDVIQDIKDSVAQFATRKGWVKRQNRRYIV